MADNKLQQFEEILADTSLKELQEMEKKIEAAILKINPYAALWKMSNKQFGETWSEAYVRSHIPNLTKDNGAGHDMKGVHYNHIELKSSRIKFENSWTMNQLHPSQADACIFIWYDIETGTEKFCLIPTKDLLSLCTLNYQHGSGCYSLGSTAKNRKVLEKYMLPSWEALNEVV